MKAGVLVPASKYSELSSAGRTATSPPYRRHRLKPTRGNTQQGSGPRRHRAVSPQTRQGRRHNYTVMGSLRVGTGLSVRDAKSFDADESLLTATCGYSHKPQCHFAMRRCTSSACCFETAGSIITAAGAMMRRQCFPADRRPLTYADWSHVGVSYSRFNQNPCILRWYVSHALWTLIHKSRLSH